VDAVATMKAAWVATRGSRTLRGLGVISGLQIVVNTLVIAVLLVPLLGLQQLAVVLSSAPDGPAALADLFSAGYGRLLLDYLPAVFVGVGLLVGVWLVLGIVDVAAQAGMIREADAFRANASAGVGIRLRMGFTVWWRVAGLLAVAVMPNLLVLLLMALVTLFGFSLPLARGEIPSPLWSVGGQMALTPLQAIASIVTVVLGVIVQFALRSAVLDDMPWRPALRIAIRLVKDNAAHVVVAYLIMVAISGVATLAAAIAVLVAAGLVGAVALVASTVTPSVAAPFSVALGTVTAVGLSAAGVYAYALLVAWVSSVWTFLWRSVSQSGGEDVLARAGAAKGALQQSS
jgi:hypothetical protein